MPGSFNAVWFHLRFANAVLLGKNILKKKIMGYAVFDTFFFQYSYLVWKKEKKKKVDSVIKY